MPSLTIEMPCIRCGACATACPEQLQPQQLLSDLRARELDRARRHGLGDCLECGLCDQACPSDIALLARFREARQEIAQSVIRTGRADAARQRYLQRALRLQRDSNERAAKEITLAQQASSTDAVAAAIERARLRRQAREPR